MGVTSKILRVVKQIVKVLLAVASRVAVVRQTGSIDTESGS